MNKPVIQVGWQAKIKSIFGKKEQILVHSNRLLGYMRIKHDGKANFHYKLVAADEWNMNIYTKEPTSGMDMIYVPSYIDQCGQPALVEFGSIYFIRTLTICASTFFYIYIEQNFSERVGEWLSEWVNIWNTETYKYKWKQMNKLKYCGQ